MRVAVLNDRGKISTTSDGRTMYYYQIEDTINEDGTVTTTPFEISATAKINSIAAYNQAGFGLMVRDDMYINQKDKGSLTDYAVAGALADSLRYNFYRKEGTLNTPNSTVYTDKVSVGGVYKLKILHNGTDYICSLKKDGEEGDGQVTTLQLNLNNNDKGYRYVGMFAARNADVSFSDIILKVNGEVVYDQSTQVVQKYSVTVTADENGSAQASAEEAIEDALVTLTATPNEGYIFDKWEVQTGEGLMPATVTNNTFKMPQGNVSIKAIFKKIPTEWSFRSDGGLMQGSGKEVNQVSGKVFNLEGLVIDTTASGAKFHTDRGDGAQINKGTIIKIPVKGPSKVTIEGYKSTTIYNIDGEKAEENKQTQTFTCKGTDGYATFEMLQELVAGSNGEYLYGIKVEQMPVVKVFGTITGAKDGIDIIFTEESNRESKIAVRDTIENNGAYEVTLYGETVTGGQPTYAISFSDPGYSANEPKTITVGKTEINKDIQAQSLSVETVQGTIKFPDEVTIPTDLKLVFTSKDESYTQTVELKGNNTFTVTLEKGLIYDIEATGTGIREYDYTNELDLSSDSTVSNRTIIFTKKHLYQIALQVKSFDNKLDVSDFDIIFTDTEDDRYTYTCEKGNNTIDLRKGTYSVSVSKKVEYPYYLNCENLVVGNENRTYAINFDERLVWDFTIKDPVLTDDVQQKYENPNDPDGDQKYNGLYVNTYPEGKFNVRPNEDRVQVNNTTLVKIPVSGRGKVVISSADGGGNPVTGHGDFNLKKLTNKGQDASTLSDQNKNGEIAYNEDTRYVLMEATNLVWLTKIEVIRDAAIEVRGSILNPDNYDISNCKVSFVNQTDNSTIPVTVESDGSYTVKLTSGHTYVATLSGNPLYGFANTNKTITAENADLQGKDLTVVARDTITYTGNITGFDENYERLDKLKVILTAGVEKVELDIKSDMSFEGILESDVEYTIQLEGVDDYKITSESTIKKTENYNADITVSPKTTYEVSGKFLKLDNAQVTEVSFTYVNEGALDKNYVYKAELNAAKDGYTIQLREGEYEASAVADGYETKTHVIVKDGAVEKDLLFIYTDTSPLEWKADLYVGYKDREDSHKTITKALQIAKRMNPTSEAKRITIHIAPGTYREQITVDVPYITFVNDTPEQVVKLTWYYGVGYKYYSIKPVDRQYGFYDEERAYEKTEKNEVYRWGCTVRVRGTDFRAENIVFENSFNRYLTDEEIADGVEPIEQKEKKPERNKSLDLRSYAAGERAAALYIEDQGDRAEFYNCQFLSNQDTIGTGSTTPHSYFRNCLIEGNTDYICGAGDAVFEECELKFAGYSDASSGGYITAASLPLKYGYLFLNCKITGTTNEGSNKDIGYLGRPWFAVKLDENEKPIPNQKRATVTFVNTMLDRADIIQPVGWKEMSGTKPEDAIYKEYNTTLKDGTAADTSKRTANTVVSKNPVSDVKVYFGSWTPTYYVDAPTAKPTQGKIPMGTPVEISSTTTGAEIYYTLDGKEPTEKSTLYADGISLGDEEKTVTVKAIAVKNGLKSSVSTFEYTVVDPAKFVAAPTATPKEGEVAKGTEVTLGCVTEGADIYYTTDGTTEPTEDSQKYEAPITINEAVTIKAIAIKGVNKSEVVTFAYTVKQAAVDPVTITPPTSTLNPGTVPVGKTVTLQAENGATIYYTINGDEPTGKPSELYDGKPIALGSEAKTIVIKAIAVKGEAKSKVATFTYTVSTELDPDKFVEAPVFDIPSGKEVEPGTKVALTNPEEGVKVYYTMDGTEPTSGSTEYKAPIDLGTKAGEVVIKAIAFRGENKSSVSTYEYTIVEGGTVEKDQVEAPEATPAAGEIEAGTQIKLESKTEGATIYYTIDGTEPTTESTEYKEPITINEAVTIKAFAVKEGLKPSKFVEFKYTIKDNTNTPVAPDDPGSTKPDAKDIWITGLEKSYPYTGAKIIPDIKVWDCDVKGADRLLTPGVDYTVTYKNNVKPTDDKTTKDKMPTVIVTGKGNYFGKDVTETFGIAYVAEVTDEKAISVKGAKIELVETKYAPTYDGTPKNPAFKLVFKGKTPVTYEYEYNLETGKYVRLDNDKEMNVNIAVSNNVSKGTATILVSGKKEKNKVTSVKATFKILPVDLSKAAVEVKAGAGVYAVKGAVPESLTVTCGGKTLVNGIDYTVKYGNNKNAGNQVGTIAITGKGNYTKKASTNVKFDIKPLDLSEISVSAVTACEGITPGKIKATVVDGDGNALKPSQYKLTIYQADKTTAYGAKDRTKLTADTEIYVEATAAEKEKNLTGTTKKECFKVGKDISKAKFKLKKGLAKEYTGAEVKLTKEDFESVTYKDKSGTSNLTLDAEYEIIEYSNNINKGTATAVIRGKGSYSGTKIIKFKIKQKKMVKGSESTTNK